MQVQVKRVDTELFVPIPIELVDGFGDTVEVHFENGRIVVSRLDDPYHTIDELLEGMTPYHLHEEIRTGPPRGSEVW